MAFPVVEAINGGNNNANSTNHTVNLPAGIQASDLLIVFFVCDANPTITFPEGWTELFHATYVNALNFATWYRVADGEEGATIVVTTSASERSAHTSYRISGYAGTPEAATYGGSGYFPDPPNLTPTWGAKDTLWFACEGNDANKTVTVYPTDYTDGRNDYANNFAGCGVGTARRELNAESEDPNNFTISGNEQFVGATVAIQPEEAAPEKVTQYLPGNDLPVFPHEMDLIADKLPCPPPYD